jgi:hypothetical protein
MTMENTPTERKTGGKDENRPRPYPPSWINHLNTWVARQRWPGWYFYFGLWLVLVIVQVATMWLEGTFPIGTVFPAQLFIPAMIALFLGMVQFLDSRAAAALTTLQPALTATVEDCSQLRYQLTTMPAWPSILAGLVAVGVIALLGVLSGVTESSIEALAASPIASNLLLLVYYVGWWVLGAFMYHTIHQLRVINRIYTAHTRVHLFAMSPLYAFSGVTALTAAVLALATYAWTALNPDNLSNPVSIAMISLITILALAVFAWPLLGTRRLLTREKAQWLDQVSLRVETVFAEIHERVDARETKEAEELAKLIAVLEKERDALKGISTWPWQPETLRFLVTALLVPLLIWIIQFVVQLVLGS